MSKANRNISNLYKLHVSFSLPQSMKYQIVDRNICDLTKVFLFNNRIRNSETEIAKAIVLIFSTSHSFR